MGNAAKAVDSTGKQDLLLTTELIMSKLASGTDASRSELSLKHIEAAAENGHPLRLETCLHTQWVPLEMGQKPWTKEPQTVT